jgi:hypothetical protein
VIFTGLVAQAASSDLKAKRLLFDVLVRLQQANICALSDMLPEIQLDESEGIMPAEVAAEIDRLAISIGGQSAAHEGIQREALPNADDRSEVSVSERYPDNRA